MATRIPVIEKPSENEPVELHVEDFEKEEELNESFDNTFKDKKKQTPLYKQWWLWALLAALIIGILVGFKACDKISDNSLDDVRVTTTASADQTTTVAPKASEGASATANDVVVPAGASVQKLSEGWGLYDANRRLVTSYNGIASNNNGTWYIKNGKVDFDFTGNLTVNGTTYPVKGGKVDISAPAADPNVGTETQQKALRKASEYLREMPLSYSSLKSVLVSDGFSREDAGWACDHCGADWNEMARQKALENMKLTTFTHEDLVEQLLYEGFTREQAEYGVTKAGL